jgi:D-sedoheptulose 7-phosphate isomerase
MLVSEPSRRYASRYFATLDRIARSIVVSNFAGECEEFDVAMDRLVALCREVGMAGGKLIFVGNGGSASIASHMAVDFTKNGGVKAVAFNDPVFLTCLGNDLGYEQVFAFQVERHAEPRDALIAISSSGRSASILNAVAAARGREAKVVTMSGFDDRNPLRSLGDLNFYVPAGEYGYVELTHCSLAHCILDALTGVRTD